MFTEASFEAVIASTAMPISESYTEKNGKQFKVKVKKIVFYQKIKLPANEAFLI